MTRSISQAASLVLTIGHSTRTLELFIRMLKAHEVTKVVDIRTAPRSRRNPSSIRRHCQLNLNLQA